MQIDISAILPELAQKPLTDYQITMVAAGLVIPSAGVAQRFGIELEQARAELAEAKELITSYQIAKDNLELKLARAVLANEKPIVGTFAGHWTY